jgi:hypothetical protein
MAELEPPAEDADFHYKVVLLKCPACENPLVGKSSLDITIDPRTGEGVYVFLEPRRVWPDPEKSYPGEIPGRVRAALEEAALCFRAKAYSACVVMVGRTLEELSLDMSAEGDALAKQLKNLRDREVIDSRLYEWAEALRHHRNLGAHASGFDASSDDAKDVLEFAEAICEYVYVLTRRFERFMKRQKLTSGRPIHTRKP